MMFPYAELEKSFPKNWQPSASWVKSRPIIFSPQLKKNWIGKHTFISTLEIVFSLCGLKLESGLSSGRRIYAWPKWDLRQLSCYITLSYNSGQILTSASSLISPASSSCPPCLGR